MPPLPDTRRKRYVPADLRTQTQTRHIAMILRPIILAAMLSFSAVLLQSCITEHGEDADESTLVAIGDTAPDFTVRMTDGSAVTLSELRGRVVMLHFWSPDCPMCQEEMGVVQEAVVDRIAGSDIYYLPIARDGEHDTIEEFCRQKGCGFAAGLDPDRSIYTLYATSFVPRMFIIDRSGTIRAIYVEYSVDRLDAIVSEAESLL